jgi:hypothetical protein
MDGKMSIFLIGYDLHEGENYEDLIQTIKSLGSWWHCLDSTWLVSSTSDASTIRGTLKPHLRKPDSNGGDKLLIVKITTPTNWACTGAFSDECKTWLKDNL